MTVRVNIVAHNHDDGIDVDGHNTVVQRNTATRNGDDGIGVGAKGLNVLIKDNTTNSNFDLGIQPIMGTAVDGGGNTASDIGDPRECVAGYLEEPHSNGHFAGRYWVSATSGSSGRKSIIPNCPSTLVTDLWTPRVSGPWPRHPFAALLEEVVAVTRAARQEISRPRP